MREDDDGHPPYVTGRTPIGSEREERSSATDPEVTVEELLASTGVTEPGRRIYVNRNLRLSAIGWIGFDMDYTLAPYAKRALEALSFEMTKARMVEELGYPEEVLALPYDAEFVARGLAIDKRHGNTLKIDRHGYVGRAYHGRRRLDRSERHRLYRKVKIRLSADRYHWVDTLFSLPEAALYAEIVDLYELELKVPKVAYWKLFEDIRQSIDACHRDGSLKSTLVRSLDEYLIQDPELPQTLHKLRSADKRLFVLTNSEWSYTNEVMAHLLDGKMDAYPTWRSYFDLVIVEAQKPAFFTESLPFHAVDPDSGGVRPSPADEIRDHGIYRGGSTRELARRRPDLIGEHVLYVGDHIYGDVVRSKRETLWRAALILEELEDELVLQRQSKVAQSELDALDERRALLEDHVNALAHRLSQEPVDEDGSRRGHEQLRLLLDRKRRELSTAIEGREQLERRIERTFNRYWGSVFREGNELSHFGRQVEEYACIYTSRVSNLLWYAPTQYFQSPRHWLPHEKTA